MADDYNPQAMVDRALVALAYYEALGKPGDQRAVFEQEYSPKYLVSSMMALVGLMINMSAITLADSLESADDIERLTIQRIREQLIALGRAVG